MYFELVGRTVLLDQTTCWPGEQIQRLECELASRLDELRHLPPGAEIKIQTLLETVSEDSSFRVSKLAESEYRFELVPPCEHLHPPPATQSQTGSHRRVRKLLEGWTKLEKDRATWMLLFHKASPAEVCRIIKPKGPVADADLARYVQARVDSFPCVKDEQVNGVIEQLRSQGVDKLTPEFTDPTPKQAPAITAKSVIRSVIFTVAFVLLVLSSVLALALVALRIWS